MKNPFRRAVKAPEFDESDLAALRELRGVEHIPSPRHLPRFSVSSLSKQLIGLSEQDRRLFGQISRQDEVPANAIKLHVRSINDGYYAPYRRPVFRAKDGDVPIEVARLENVTVTPRGFIIHEDNLIWDAHTIGPKWQAGGESLYLVNELTSNSLGGYDPFNQTIHYWGEPQASLPQGEHFIFNSGLATLNFAHAIHDTILQIPTFHECAVETPALRPFMPGNASGLLTVDDLLKYTLGKYAAERVFGLGKFCRINSLLVPTPHLNDETQQISVTAMRRMRSLLDVSLSHYAATPTEDLFVSRVQSSRGAFEATASNYHDFLSLLEKHGIKTVDASALTGEEYFEQFRRGRIFIGLHGAGLLNSMLAPNARLIELSAPGPPPWVKNRFGLMAVAAGMPFAHIAPKHVEGFQIELDLPAIDAAIAAVREAAPA